MKNKNSQVKKSNFNFDLVMEGGKRFVSENQQKELIIHC